MIGGTDPNEGTTLTQAVSDIQAALATLQRLGRSAEADAVIVDAEQSTSYDAIAADTTRNDDFKRTQYARVYTGVMTTLARKLTAAANLAGSKDQDDALRVYGIKGLAGDVASLAISRRDAADRVEKTDTHRLRDLLAIAVRNGDEVLSHAIAEWAIKNGDHDIATDFQAVYPNLADAVERLWNAEHRRMTAVDIKVAWRVAALKPSAIGSLQPYEIQALAASKNNVGA